MASSRAGQTKRQVHNYRYIDRQRKIERYSGVYTCVASSCAGQSKRQVYKSIDR